MSKNNENKLVPKLRFPEFINDGEWGEEVLEKLSHKIMVGIASAATHAYRKSGIMLFRNQNIKEGYLDDSNVIFIDEEYEKEHKNKRLKAGDLLTARTGYPGTTCVVPAKYEGSQSFTTLIIRPNTKIIDSTFLCYYINSETGQAFFNSTKIGGGQKNVNASSLSEMPIPYPSEKEQQKIAACLSSFDNVIKAEIQNLNLLQNHKKGLLQNLLPEEGETVPKFRFGDFEESGDWEETTLTQVADYENGKAHEQDIDSTGNFIVVNSKFISQDGIVKKFTNTAFCPATKGDVLMVLSDIPNGKAIAKCFLVEEDNRYTVNQRICRITPRNLNSKILYYLLNRNPYFLAFDDGVKQTNLRREDVLNCPLLIPSDPKEQEKIADTLSSIDELINAQSQKVQAIELHKKGLLQGLFPNTNNEE